MIDKQRLLQKGKTCGIQLTEELTTQLDRYAEILVAYNQKVNLTAINKP